MQAARDVLELVIAEDEDFGWLGLTAVVNGEPIAGGWHGASVPANELLTEESPLLPGSPHRAILRVCTCGIPDCGHASALVVCDAGVVSWREWDVDLPYGDDDDPSPPVPPPMREFAFAERQYVSVVTSAIERWSALCAAELRKSRGEHS